MKILFNKNDYINFIEFLKETAEKQKEELSSEIKLINNFIKPTEYFLNKDDIIEFQTENEYVDAWIFHNNKSEIIQSNIKDAYPTNWVPFLFENAISFSEKCVFLSISSSLGTIYFFKNLPNREIDVFKKILSFGTTNFIEQFAKGFENLFLGEKHEKIVNIFLYFNIPISQYDGKFFVGNEEVFITPKIDYFIFPEIKVNTCVNENMMNISEYDEFAIFFSTPEKIYALVDYEDFNKDKLPLYLSDLKYAWINNLKVF